MLYDLALHHEEGYVSLKDIADRQGISKKYLEQIVPLLNKTGLLRTNRGNKGGYMLAGSPDEVTVGDVLRATEGSLAPAGVKLWPTQLMMSVGNLIIAGLLYLAGLKCKKRGQIIGLYLILYAIGRFGIEFFRNDYRGAVGALSTSQFISIFMCAIGVAIFVWRTLAKEKEVAPEVVAEKKAVKKVKTEKVEKKEEVSEEVEK